MERFFVKPLKNKSPEDALIPLINIVFLLLIFFMVAGSIQPLVPVDVNHPFAPNIDNPITAIAAQILITEHNEIYWNNKKISLVKLQKILTKQLPKKINLHADKNVTAINLDAILNVIRRHQVESINLITKKSMEN